jgi:hypothetical protein
MDDDIDEMINAIDALEKKADEKNLPEVQKAKEIQLDVEDINAVAETLVNMVQEDRSKADEVFKMFFTDIGFGKDRSEASKEALTRALELKIEASKNIIELLKIKTKANEIKSNVGVFFTAMSGKKAGIDISSLKAEIKETK